jgi:hypothetical protein
MHAASPARQRFAARLVEEASFAAASWRDPLPFDTVYFGGGTPSELSAEELARVLGECRTQLALATPEPWAFLEANPEDVTPQACAAWRALGVRTLSLGAQSFSDAALRFRGRRHSGRQARAAVETALGAGFDTVSLDLIFGLRGQTADPDGLRARYGVDLLAANGSLVARFVDEGRLFVGADPEGGRRLVPTLAGLAVADGLAAAFDLSLTN